MHAHLHEATDAAAGNDQAAMSIEHALKAQHKHNNIIESHMHAHLHEATDAARGDDDEAAVAVEHTPMAEIITHQARGKMNVTTHSNAKREKDRVKHPHLHEAADAAAGDDQAAVAIEHTLRTKQVAAANTNEKDTCTPTCMRPPMLPEGMTRLLCP